MTLRNDATRLLIRPKDARPLRSVVSRQGQVLLDADLDQSQRLILDRVERETDDILGMPGRLAVPPGNEGFRIVAGSGPLNVRIRPGHGYLGGWRLDNPAEVQLDTQPHPRAGETAAVPFALVIKTQERFVDPVEESAFADAALGDAEAAGRGLLDWQVFALPLTGVPSCATLPLAPEWLALTAASKGSIGIKVAAAAPGDDPCSLLPQGGYSRLENQLYRIEVHGGVPVAGGPVADGPRLRLQGLQLKLSRSNASLMVPVAQVSGRNLVLSQPPRDPRRWFAQGSFAELVQSGDDLDPRAALQANRLFGVLQVRDTQVVLQASAADVAATGVAANAGWFLRLWEPLPDGAGVVTLAAPGGGGLTPEVSLGDGLSLIGGGGAAATFRRGDFWTFAARADGTIDWPAGAVQELPHGPNPRYAPLAVVTATGIEDCRIAFGRLTDPVLHYRGGDGQEVFPPGTGGAVTLPTKLRLQVLRGRVPVVGAKVEFRLPAGAEPSQVAGQAVLATQAAVVTSDAAGMVAVDWVLNAAAPDKLHQVTAVLVANAPGAADQPLTFTASFRLARQVSYKPNGCAILKDEDNVQDALDALCAAIVPTDYRALTLRQIMLLNAKKTPVVDLVKDDLIANGLRVPPDAFAGGIGFNFDVGDLKHLGFDPIDPIVEVSLDLPYPVTIDEKRFWGTKASLDKKPIPFAGPFGYQTIRLQGQCRVDEVAKKFGFSLIWLPSPPAQMFLETLNLTWGGQAANPDMAGWQPEFQPELLVRLRLRAAHVWADDKKTGDRIYLNAEHLGTRAGMTDRELALALRDPQRSADLDCFFYAELNR